MNKTEMKRNNYDAFVEKFKPKKTTDDCYTPPYIYDAVLEWLKQNADIQGKKIIRPFYPGGDYKSVEYPESCIVIDNPPFSILAEIKRFYLAKGIRFFLFAPHLTLFSTDNDNITYIITDATIRYENGATINTDFVTNLPDFAGLGILGSYTLKALINQAQKRAKKEENERKELPKYSYPDHVITSNSIAYIINGGIDIIIPRKEMMYVRRLDAQIPIKKSIFGHGFLCSDNMANYLHAEKLKAKKLKAVYHFKLSAREREIVEALNSNI